MLFRSASVFPNLIAGELSPDDAAVHSLGSLITPAYFGLGHAEMSDYTVYGVEDPWADIWRPPQAPHFASEPSATEVARRQLIADRIAAAEQRRRDQEAAQQ